VAAHTESKRVLFTGTGPPVRLVTDRGRSRQSIVKSSVNL
jgi:hypothetical protein